MHGASIWLTNYTCAHRTLWNIVMRRRRWDFSFPSSGPCFFFCFFFQSGKNMYDMVLFCKMPLLWGWRVKNRRRRRQWLIRRGTGFEHGATRCLHKVTYLYMPGNHRETEKPNPAKNLAARWYEKMTDSDAISLFFLSNSHFWLG